MRPLFLASAMLIGGCVCWACGANPVDSTNPDLSSTASIDAGDVSTNAPPLATPFSTAYVEVNSNNFANPGCYEYGNPALPLFGFAVVFAANINSTNGQPALVYNPQVQAVLNSGSIATLRALGIRVLLDVLGNHQNAGWGCFGTFAAADAFAAQCADAVSQYGLDGIDIDDEYSTCATNPDSLVLAVSALRARLGATKYITKALYSDSSYFAATYNGKKAGDILDYGWEMSYSDTNYIGRLQPYLNAGMPRSKLSIGVNVSGSDQATAARFIKNGGYAGVMVYNVANNSQASLSVLSSALFGNAVDVKANCLK